jgi:mannosyltransferase OCH1-like enzyme
MQYWDDDAPPDIIDLMMTWKQLNPSFEWECINDDKARSFLELNFPANVLHSYGAARQPAQKADLFRLAWLWKNGGIYVDADDACFAPIETFVPPEASLVVYQEDYQSIGNNFIAVIPGHPVIGAALNQAVRALNRGDNDLFWLSTGPGLLTRTFAQQWAASDEPEWIRSTRMMSLGEIQRVIGLHCPVRYKSTERHWSRSSSRRQSRKTA